MSRELVSVVHLGLHKTATTSLQLNLFRKATNRPYVGLHGTRDWERVRGAWFDALIGGDAAPGMPAPLVFSDESVLLRAGGVVGLDSLAKAVARVFPSCKIALTVRRPSSLLVSTYFQSLRGRRIALGFRGGRPVCDESLRFCSFDEWWRRLASDPDASLCGLLAYRRVAAAFENALGRDAVEVLPIEWLRDQPGRYAAGLERLGFEPADMRAFLAAGPENVRGSKTLDRMRPSAWNIGRLIESRGLGAWPARLMPGPLRSLAERAIYSGKRRDLVPGGPEPQLLAAIDAAHAADWQFFAGIDQ